MPIPLPSLNTFRIDNCNLFLVGKPRSGKSYTAQKIAKNHPNHVLIDTDDFIQHNYNEQRYQLLAKDIRTNIDNGKNVIVAGHFCFEILQLLPEKYYPDAIIEVVVSDKIIFDIYHAQCHIHKFNAALYYYNKQKEQLRYFMEKCTRNILHFTFDNEDIITQIEPQK